VRNPDDLGAYVAAEKLAIEIYRLTESFPPEEKYGLTNQMRRAAVSIFSNLAEGCSRESQRDFARFVEMALGSAMELRAQLRFAQRLGWTGALEQMSSVEMDVQGQVLCLVKLCKAVRTPNPGAPGAFRGDRGVSAEPRTPERERGPR
jgi:four helix bundle protein